MSRRSLLPMVASLLAACGTGDAGDDRPPEPDAGGDDDRAAITAAHGPLTCNPSAPGEAGVVWIPGPMRRMRHDPTRCFLYGVTSGPNSQFVVIDTAAKEEVARVDLPVPALDLDVADDGSIIAIAHGEDSEQLSVVTPPAWDTVTAYEAHDAEAVAAPTGGDRVYYLAHASLYELDLATGYSERRASAVASPDGDLELSPDQRTLYVADVGGSPGSIRRFEIADDGTMTRGERTPYELMIDYFGGQMAISADGSTVGYSDFLFDTSDFAAVRGAIPRFMLAFDRTARFVVDAGGVSDVELGRMISRHGSFTYNAAVTPDDAEIWYFDDQGELLHHASVLDYLDPAALGRREVAPLALDAYTFSKLIADPVRPWLYGLDPYLDELVVLDRATLAPQAAFLLGTAATDLALDPGGRYLYAGHYYTWKTARIELDTLAWDGMVPTRQAANQLVALREGRLAVIGGYSWRQVSLLDPIAGAVLDVGDDYFTGLGAASPDGNQLYVGESDLSRSCLTVLDSSGDTLEVVRELPFSDCPEFPRPGMVGVPGTTDVFWAHGRWRTDDLTKVLDLPLPVVIVTVTPDGLLAISADTVYDAVTGEPRMTLPEASSAQALSPDGRTLYLGLEGRIERVDLSPLLP